MFVNSAVFDYDQQGHRSFPPTWSSSMSMSSTFYGTFRPPVPHLGGLRHVVFLSVSVSYSPDVSGLQYTDTAA